MIVLSSLLGALGTLSILVIIYILAKLSERFGSVVRMRPRYRYYYIALGFLAVGWLVQLLVLAAGLTPTGIQNWLISPWVLLIGYYLPMTIGVTLGLVITWSYWSWLVAERNG